jgi:hypothetical protein
MRRIRMGPVDLSELEALTKQIEWLQLEQERIKCHLDQAAARVNELLVFALAELELPQAG